MFGATLGKCKSWRRFPPELTLLFLFRSSTNPYTSRPNKTPKMSSRVVYRLAGRASRQQRALSMTSISRNAPVAPWEPALPQGVSPAYDAAISYLADYQSRTLSKLNAFKSKLPETPSHEELQQLAKLEIEAYANDPAVRRTFKETGGEGQMDKIIMRWLGEENWKKEGGLDLLMQRALQMNVVPDLLPEIPQLRLLPLPSPLLLLLELSNDHHPLLNHQKLPTKFSTTLPSPHLPTPTLPLSILSLSLIPTRLITRLTLSKNVSCI